MKSVQNDGPAFPGLESPAGGYSGMTLRDYFAAQAMNSLMHRWTVSDHMPDSNTVARHAYEAADAMLNARERQ